MGQDWDLVNIDKRAELRVGLAEFWDFLKWTPTEQLVGLLRKQHWRPFRITGDDIRASKARADIPLVRLPQEIIDQIVYHVAVAPGQLDTICLALTCAYFFRLLAGTVQDILRHDTGPWAGDRLAFVGDAGGRGWPYEVYELLQFAPLTCTVTEGRFARRHIPSYRQLELLVYGKLYRSVKERLGGEKASFRRFDRLARLLKEEPDFIKHGDKAAVLRNLTTKEYVRDAALAASEYAYSLGEVVMVQTIWSESGRDVGRLGTKGRWATHRFDISVMADVAGGEWTDVSDEAVERMALAATDQFRKRNGRRA